MILLSHPKINSQTSSKIPLLVATPTCQEQLIREDKTPPKIKHLNSPPPQSKSKFPRPRKTKKFGESKKKPAPTLPRLFEMNPSQTLSPQNKPIQL